MAGRVKSASKAQEGIFGDATERFLDELMQGVFFGLGISNEIAPEEGGARNEASDDAQKFDDLDRAQIVSRRLRLFRPSGSNVGGKPVTLS